MKKVFLDISILFQINSEKIYKHELIKVLLLSFQLTISLQANEMISSRNESLSFLRKIRVKTNWIVSKKELTGLIGMYWKLLYIACWHHTNIFICSFVDELKCYISVVMYNIQYLYTWCLDVELDWWTVETNNGLKNGWLQCSLKSWCTFHGARF